MTTLGITAEEYEGTTAHAEHGFARVVVVGKALVVTGYEAVK